MLDKLKGAKIKQHFNDIKSVLEKFDSNESITRRKGHLARLLDHSIKNTVFYSEYKNYASIHDFPVIDKNGLRANFGDFQAQQGFMNPTYHVYTSGSTGTPFQVNQDRGKKERNTADTLFFGQKGGYTLGQPLFYIRKWDASNAKSSLTKWVQNVIPIDVSELNNGYIKKIVKKISKKRTSVALIGYSSAYKDLCSNTELRKLKLDTSVSSIIAIAEALGPKTKKDMESLFNANVLSRYSNAENGIIAQQLPGFGNNFHINWASYYVEILEIGSNRPTKNGQLGRIVITDLFNYSMPMVRYDTGDLGIMDDTENLFNNAPVLTKIEGRKMDVLFDTEGKRTTPYLAYELEDFPELKQFQVIQEGKKDYLILLNTEGTFHGENKASVRLKKYLGSDANIYFKYVNEIPRLSSGKRKLTLNKYYLEKNT